MDQQQESQTEAVKNTHISSNDNGNFLSQHEDSYDALNGTERPNSISDNDISATTGGKSRTEEVEMDSITTTTSPSSIPNSQSIDIHYVSFNVTKRGFHKSDTELASKGFKRGHKRHASEVFTDGAPEVKSGTSSPNSKSGTSTPVVDRFKNFFRPKSRTPSGQTANNGDGATVWTTEIVLDFLQKFEKGKRKREDVEDLRRVCCEVGHLGTPGYRDADTGDTVLHIVVRKSLLSTLKFIVTQLHGVSEEYFAEENRSGDTAVHVAVKANHVEAVRLLLPKCGASYPRLNSKGETLLHVACRRGYERYLDLRDELDEEDREEQARRRDLPAPEEQDGGQGDTKAESSRRDENFVDRITAVKEESHEMMYVLLDRALADFQDDVFVLDLIARSPGTVFCYFAILNYAQGLQKIANAVKRDKARVRSAVNLGRNDIMPLHFACMHKSFAAGRVLVEIGASVNPRLPEYLTGLCSTPLHLLLENVKHRHLQDLLPLLKDLLEAGADPMLSAREDADTEHFYDLSEAGLDPVWSLNHGKFTGYYTAFFAAAESTMEEILEMVARYVTDEKLLASWYLWRDAFKLMSGRFKSAELFARLVNAGGDLVCTRDTMPLGYALDAGSGPRNAYFDALEMVSQEALMRQRNLKRNGGGDYDYFLRCHIFHAVKEFRPSLLRRFLALAALDRNEGEVHCILQYKPPPPLNATWLSRGSLKINLDNVFDKTALRWAVENQDPSSIEEILHHERNFHKQKNLGVICLSNQLDNDKFTMWTLDTFRKPYPDKPIAQKFGYPSLAVLFRLVLFGLFLYDYYLDYQFTRGFRLAVEDNNTNHNLETEDYKNAYWAGVVFLVLPLAIHIVVALYQTWYYVSVHALWKEYDTSECCFEPAAKRIWTLLKGIIWWFLIRIFCQDKKVAGGFIMSLELGIVLRWKRLCSWQCPVLKGRLAAPVARQLFTYLFLPLAIIYLVVRHGGTKRKNKFRDKLRLKEYWWAVVKTFEVGVKASGHIVLQCWLLSGILPTLGEVGMVDLAKMTLRGLIHYLTFERAFEVGDAERSLGKMALSSLSFMVAIANAQRTFKKKAMNLYHPVFLWVSIVCQVSAKIVSLCYLIHAAGSLSSALWAFLAHFLGVLAIKAVLEQGEGQTGRFRASLATLGNVATSGFVYVRIPRFDCPVIDHAESGDRCRECEKVEDDDEFSLDDGMGTSQVEDIATECEHVPLIGERTEARRRRRSTLVEQALFFALSFFGNVAMLTAAYFIARHRAVPEGEFLGEQNVEKVAEIEIVPAFIFVSLSSGLAWICNYAYYSVFGHPWTPTNGPELDRDTGRLTWIYRVFRKPRTVTKRTCFTC